MQPFEKSTQQYKSCIVGAYHIEQLKKELWNIFMDSKVDMYNGIQATKELHSLSKTYTLLIKDLPFVTNLSEFHDQHMLNSSNVNSLRSKGTYSNRDNQEFVRKSTQTKDFNKTENLDNRLDFNGINGKKTSVGERDGKLQDPK